MHKGFTREGPRPSVTAESGMALLEVLVALGLLAIIAVAFLLASGTTTKAAIVLDQQATAENLARVQMEYVKSVKPLASSYAPAAIPATADYSGYSAAVVVQAVPSGDVNIQKITVNINRGSKTLFTLQDYKVNR